MWIGGVGKVIFGSGNQTDVSGRILQEASRHSYFKEPARFRTASAVDVPKPERGLGTILHTLHASNRTIRITDRAILNR